MLQRWTDHDDNEVRVKDAYERNKMLIDLTAQPQEMKDLFDKAIIEGVRTERMAQVGLHLMKFTGKYELNKIAENAETYAKWLGNEYKGALHVTNVT
jgi:hypothetical protein